MQKIKDFLQIVDLLSRWGFNMVKYYYITAVVILFFRLIAAGCGAELDYRVNMICIVLICVRICYVFRKPLIKLLIPSSYRKIQ